MPELYLSIGSDGVLPIELQALAELLGAYGMKHLGEKMMLQIASQVGEIKVNYSKLGWSYSDFRLTLKDGFPKCAPFVSYTTRFKDN